MIFRLKYTKSLFRFYSNIHLAAHLHLAHKKLRSSFFFGGGYVRKQNPDIRTTLQLYPISIFTKFWTLSFGAL